MTMTARRMAGVAGLLLAISAWVFFAPHSIGGRASYATVNGTSMEPLLSGGDLVVLREASGYVPGDVVAYRSSTGGSLVLHRIVSSDAGSFTLKGDANTWMDLDTPTRREVIGKMWFSVPTLGSITQGPPLPLIFLALAALTGAVQFARAKRGRRSVAVSVAPAGRERPQTQRDGAKPRANDRAAAMTCGAIAVVFAMFAVMAFAAPAGARTTELGYTHQGSFSYSANVARGAAYPDGTVDAGEPIFLRIVDQLSITFRYDLTSASTPDFTGAGSMRVEIRDEGSRWNRWITLGAATKIVAGSGTVTSDLDVATLRRLVAQMEKTTGIAPPHYVLTVHADIALVGTLNGIPASPKLAASLPFTLNGLTMLPTLTLQPGQAPTTAAEFTSNATGTVQTQLKEAGAVVLGLKALPMRAASTAGAVIFGLLAIAYSANVARARRKSSVPRSVERFIVEAASDASVLRPGASVRAVASMDDLGWIAQSGQRPILHEKLDTVDRYEVADGDTIYRYEQKVEEDVLASA